jgi:peptidoglycan/LPS O-acetylase OafA/YrhL
MGSGNRFAGLQVARALAALSIAYFHSWHVTLPFPADTSHPIPFLKDYGWLAVDFFFAISGYVICMVITKPEFSRSKFLIRRAFRLYPLWILASYEYFHFAKNIVGINQDSVRGAFYYSLTLLPTNGHPVYDLGWTLQHEVAFYVIAALIVPSLGLTGLIAFMSASAIAAKLFELPWYLAEFFSYYPNFIAGMLAFVAHNRFKQLTAWPLIAIGCLLLSLFATQVGRAAFPVALFVLLLGFVNLKIDKNSVLGRICIELGDASYSIYLIHPLVFLYVYSLLQPPLPPIWSHEIIRFGCIAYICVLSIICWRLYEKPFIALGLWITSSNATRNANKQKSRLSS